MSDWEYGRIVSRGELYVCGGIGGRWGYWKLAWCGIGGHGGFVIGCEDVHVGFGIGGGRGIGLVYGIMGWADFSRCRLLATATAGGIESVGMGGTSSKMG